MRNGQNLRTIPIKRNGVPHGEKPLALTRDITSTSLFHISVATHFHHLPQINHNKFHSSPTRES